MCENVKQEVKMKSRILSFRVDPEGERILECLAAVLQRSRSDTLRLLLHGAEKFLEEIEREKKEANYAN